MISVKMIVRRRQDDQFCLLPLFLQIFGGLVWILVASTYVLPHNPQGWVMAVSIFCFIMTFVWLVVFACGVHQNKASWAAAVSPPHVLMHFEGHNSF